MGTQKNIAAQIQQAQAEYILCLKANHPTVFKQLNAWFKTAIAQSAVPKAIAQGCLPRPSEHTTEAGHHRTEIRSCGRSCSTNCGKANRPLGGSYGASLRFDCRRRHRCITSQLKSVTK
ncbi:transposase [Scytonema sp. HK-05]|uniref:hypothetical protein n=1 Tax=Scytonema sp. HK-05 TaxID=1137095 RepID=UPI000935C03F|nr:hypothetical protein [Scytonema sp. HK-05]OKH53310.1 hypothetical protein NIES2130_30600 [Scytonema sp. HK-05]BAY49781.1 transposase [Scytonema sp. HK-05]